jgi:hypothetical protein
MLSNKTSAKQHHQGKLASKVFSALAKEFVTAPRPHGDSTRYSWVFGPEIPQFPCSWVDDDPPLPNMVKMESWSQLGLRNCFKALETGDLRLQVDLSKISIDSDGVDGPSHIPDSNSVERPSKLPESRASSNNKSHCRVKLMQKRLVETIGKYLISLNIGSHYIVKKAFSRVKTCA